MYVGVNFLQQVIVAPFDQESNEKGYYHAGHCGEGCIERSSHAAQHLRKFFRQTFHRQTSERSAEMHHRSDETKYWKNRCDKP